VELTYIYTVENRLKAIYDADELLVAMAYDGDGNRIFQLNYNLHTDDDWKGNSGNGNGNNKDNSGSGNSGNTSGETGTGSSGSNTTTNTSTGTANDNNGNATGNINNTDGSQNQSGILFPIASEVSELESELIGMTKTTGKEKNYELIEYVNDVNREHTEVLQELNINGIMDTSYTYGNERLTNERFTGEAAYYTYDPRGSVSGLTDSEGMLHQSYRYDPFGGIDFGKPQYNNVYAYNAESYNGNTEHQYLRARYYDTDTADFITEDSYLGKTSDPLTLNRYNYVKSSPLNYTDPSGHWAQIVVGAIIGGVVSGFTNYIMQKISGNEEINQRELWTNVLSGVISGALGGTELKKSTLAIYSAMISGITYWQSREANNQEINWVDLIIAVAAGALVGFLGGNAKGTNAEIKSYSDALKWMQVNGYMSYFNTTKEELCKFVVQSGFISFIKTLTNSGITNLWDLVKLAKDKIKAIFCGKEKNEISTELNDMEDDYKKGGKNILWEVP